MLEPAPKLPVELQPANAKSANVAFRAVHVPPGDHVVDFRYKPTSVRLGLATAALAGLGIALLLVTSRAQFT